MSDMLWQADRPFHCSSSTIKQEQSWTLSVFVSSGNGASLPTSFFKLNVTEPRLRVDWSTLSIVFNSPTQFLLQIFVASSSCFPAKIWRCWSPCPGSSSSYFRWCHLPSRPKWWSFKSASSQKVSSHHEDEGPNVESIPFGYCNPKECLLPPAAFQQSTGVAVQKECPHSVHLTRGDAGGALLFSESSRSICRWLS